MEHFYWRKFKDLHSDQKQNLLFQLTDSELLWALLYFKDVHEIDRFLCLIKTKLMALFLQRDAVFLWWWHVCVCVLEYAGEAVTFYVSQLTNKQ